MIEMSPIQPDDVRVMFPEHPDNIAQFIQNHLRAGESSTYINISKYPLPLIGTNGNKIPTQLTVIISRQFD
jgi:hypothetical protein